MTFVLRLPAIIVLLLLVAASLAPAIAVTVFRAGLPVDLALVDPSLPGFAEQGSWLDAGLWYGAALFFLISSIRLMRRTQGFWTWLLGFACYGARWALAQADVAASLQQLDFERYAQPHALAQAGDTPEAQVAILAVILLVGLMILIIDAADRSYWNKQGA